MPHATAQRTYAVRSGVIDGHRICVLSSYDAIFTWPFEVAFETGYPYAQVFAPSDDDVICFEPMTAPPDALRARFGPPPAVAPGDCYRARFSITVERTP
jgi:galactose mutarotase-like enzyme